MSSIVQPHRRNPTRSRKAPKKFEDEIFVNGNFDQYSRDFSGHKEDKWKSKWEDAENYYHTQNGRKFVSAAWNKESGYRLQLRDFPESLLELTSIWRDFDRELPSDMIDHIGKFLNFTQIDRALLAEDDAFIAGDESEDDCEEPLKKRKWCCSELPIDKEEWSSCSETDESDYDSDDLYEED